MAAMGGRLDFELEDPLLDAPTPSNRRRKLIGLDDLIAESFKEKRQSIDKKSKLKKRGRKSESSDDEDCVREANLSTALDQYQKQMQDMGDDEEVPRWGLRVFGTQQTPPDKNFHKLPSCELLQSLYKNEFNSLGTFNGEEGEVFLEGLLVNGWLSKLVAVRKHVEEVIAKWTFYSMMFSSKGELRTSACDFWCDMLSLGNEDDASSFRIDWVPNLSEIRQALDIYGYTPNLSSNLTASETDSQRVGPSQNILTWIKFVTASCQGRKKRPMFSGAEAKELIQITVFLFLDRKLEGLLVPLGQCMFAIVNYFTDAEWNGSCEKVAESLANRLPQDLNCLRAVECISGVDPRSKRLRSRLAYQILSEYLEIKGAKDNEILDTLISIDLKDRTRDLSVVYIYLVLADNWLLWGSLLKDNRLILEMWGFLLRKYSSDIPSTDLRSYALKVRDKASYILHTLPLASL